MQLLSALSSTTSSLAMQALPLVAPAAGDFAALIAGMVPAGDVTAIAIPGERQAAAPAGNGLPVTLAATVSPTPLIVAPDAVPAIAPPLPVSATEAVLMLPQEAAAPVAPPVGKLVPASVATAAVAAIGVLPDILPADAPVETPPNTETLAARALQMAVPPRFVLPQPRGKRAESAAPEAPPRATADEAADPEVRAEGDAVPIVVASPVVPQPAETVVLPAAPPPGELPVPTAEPAPPALSLVVEAGKVVASEPVSAKAPPMRMAKRAADAVSSAPRPEAPVTERPLESDRSIRTVEPAIGVVTPLATDGVVPAHIVVPPVADAAAPVATPPPMPVAPAASAAPAVQRPVAAAPTPAVTSAATPTRRAQPVATPAARTPSTIAIAPVVSMTPSTALPITAADVGAAIAPTAQPVTPVMAASTVLPPAAAAPVASEGPARIVVDLPVTAAETVLPPVAAAPVASVAPEGLAGVMIDLPVPVEAPPAVRSAPIASHVPAAPEMVSETAPFRQPVDTRIASRPAPSGDATPVRSATLSRPVEASALPAARPEALSVERAAVTPSVDPKAPAPVEAPAVDRRPIASEAAAPVVTVAPPLAQPAVVTPPMTRIAGLSPSDATAATNAPSVDTVKVTPSVRQAVDAPAVTPPVTRIAAVPVAEVAPVVEAVLRDVDPQAPRSRRDDDVAVPMTGGVQAPDAAVLRPVAPTAPAAQPALDTRQPQWMEGMIDRIQTLRESSGTTGNGETRIRLSPDALGDVEVAIRTGDDGKLHVHFNSDNADAGRLLAEAQPRLVQMAEARGLKLGGMQVDVGTQQQSQQSQRHAQDQGHAAPRAPRRAANQTDTQTTRSTDRIA